MIKAIVLSLTVISLSACQICPDKPPVIQYEYVVKQPPSELLEIPAYPDVQFNERSMQSDVAEWIVDIEQRSRDLELKLIKIKQFFADINSDLNKKAE